MQEQRRLQQPRRDVGPEDDPIEVVQLSGVVERVKDERDQAENVKVRALRRGPAAQQDVNTDTQVHQRNYAQRQKQRAIRGGEDERSFKGNAVAHQRISRLRPDTHRVELTLESADVSDVLALNGYQAVAGLDAGLLSGTVGLDPLRFQLTAGLDPPNPVVRRNIFTIFLKIYPGKDHGRGAGQHQDDSDKARLNASIH